MKSIRRHRILLIVSMTALVFTSADLHAQSAVQAHDEAAEIDAGDGEPGKWIVTAAAGVPIFVGVGLGHTIGSSSRIVLQAGGFPALMYAGTLQFQHTVARAGIFSAYAGLGAMAVHVTGLSWGGVGEPETALAAGPHLGLQLSSPRRPVFVALDAGLLTGDFGRRIFADNMFVGAMLATYQGQVGYMW